jgi:hypothetical protein
MSVALWTSTAFVEEAQDWVADRLHEHGLAPSGTWDQPHAREWSSAISFDTTTGERVWFKVNGGGTSYEPRLVALLGELVPGLVPEVLAVDADRAWSLSRDAGPTMRTVHPPDELWSHWEAVLARYGRAQLTLGEHVDDMIDTGAPHLAPLQLVGHFRRLRDQMAALPPQEGGLTPEQLEAVDRLAPSYRAWCEELAASPVPESVNHDDLHSANICWPADDADAARIIDWGDASVAHPFATMLATLNSIAHHAGVFGEDGDVEDPRVLRVRDAYLEPFTSLADHADLVRWVWLARATGCVSRAMSYEAALGEAAPAVMAAEDYPVRGWFLELLEPWVTAPL